MQPDNSEQGNKPEASPWRSDDQYILGVALEDADAFYARVHSFSVREPMRTVQSYFTVEHLQRVMSPSMPQLANDINAFMALSPFGPDSELVVDQTRVGKAMVDLLAKSLRRRPTRVELPDGGTEGMITSYTYGIPIKFFISNLKARVHAGEVRVAPAVWDAADLETALVGMNADDLNPMVIAVGLAVWRAEKTKGRFGPPPRVIRSYAKHKGYER